MTCGRNCAGQNADTDFAGEGASGKVYSGEMTSDLSLEM